MWTAWTGKAASEGAGEDEAGGKLPPSAALIFASASREARPTTTEASRIVGTTLAKLVRRGGEQREKEGEVRERMRGRGRREEGKNRRQPKQKKNFSPRETYYFHDPVRRGLPLTTPESGSRGRASWTSLPKAPDLAAATARERALLRGLLR